MTTEESDSEADRVLRALHAHDNDLQGEWTSKWELKTTMVAHGRLSLDELEAGLDQLEDDGKIDVDGSSYRVRDGVERPKYPGQV